MLAFTLRMMGLMLLGLVTVTGCSRSSPAPANNATISQIVPAGKTGDFSFVCPSEGVFTLVLSGDCEKSVMLWSNDFTAASEKVSALPGMQQAVERQDFAEMKRIVDKGIGTDTPLAKLYAKGVDFDVLADFRVPAGKLERSFKLVAGAHTLMVKNESNQTATIEVALVPAQ